MKNLAIILLISIFALTAFAQTPKRTATNSQNSLAKQKLGDEAEEFEKAVTLKNTVERIEALKKFVENFPNSEYKTRSLEVIVSSRAILADGKLRLKDTKSAIELFTLAVTEAPTPISEKLFNSVVLQLPTNLFYQGQRDAALELARLIEGKLDGNPVQMLGLATFYLGMEEGEEAQRLAEKAVELAPELPSAYQTLGLAYRINFDLPNSETAYTKALELDPNSIVSKRSLAEIKRAVGKSSEAIVLFNEILNKDTLDGAARTGLILALFDAGKKEQAETALSQTLEQNPRNLFLLTGAAYWYAANEQGAKAVELAKKAIEVEPRYTWAHIALARGLIQQKLPLEAEKAILIARQYGNFPTLDYELASARASAGFYRDATDDLKKTFSVSDGKISTYLGGRIFKEADNFIELLGTERRASIFEPNTADNLRAAEMLKSLLKFSQELDSAKPAEMEISRAADEFVKGDDNMKLHRQLYAANRLLDKKTALPKALELTQSATGDVDAALSVSAPAAAVLAEELYDSRRLAISRNELVVVPEIPSQTLSKILRGKIEEITGWALYQQNKPDEAVKRLKRAVSVLPEKSSWWRSGMWRLGAALEAEGKPKEALDSYLVSYDKTAPEMGKRFIIEILYEKVNGSLEGLNDLIGEKPVIAGEKPLSQTPDKNKIIAQNTAKTQPTPQPTATPRPTPVIPNRVPVAATPQPTPEITETIEDTSGNETRVQPVKMTTQTDVKEDEVEIAPLVEPTPNPTPKDEVSEDSDLIDETETGLIPKTGSSQENVTTEPKTTPTPEKVAEDLVAEATPTPQKIAEELVAKATPTPEDIDEDSVDETVPTPASEVDLSAETESANAVVPETVSASDIEKQQNAEKVDPVKTNAQKTVNPLFEPIIIKIPKGDKKNDPVNKTPNAESMPIETIKTEVPEFEIKTDTVPKSEKSTAEIKENNKTRSRVVITNESATETLPPAEVIAPCILNASRERISLINDGGKLGILVGYQEGGDLAKIKAIPGSPTDISVTYDPDIKGVNELAFFIVKSISPRKGIYTVVFEAPCGKTEVSVSVR